MKGCVFSLFTRSLISRREMDESRCSVNAIFLHLQRRECAWSTRPRFSEWPPSAGIPRTVWRYKSRQATSRQWERVRVRVRTRKAEIEEVERDDDATAEDAICARALPSGSAALVHACSLGGVSCRRKWCRYHISVHLRDR